MGMLLKEEQLIGKRNPRQTLLGHLEDTLKVFDYVVERDKDFITKSFARRGIDWSEVYPLLRQAVILHDIGKASKNWQSYIKEENTGGKRGSHAFNSVYILAQLYEESLEKQENEWKVLCILCAVLAHHGLLYEEKFSTLQGVEEVYLEAFINEAKGSCIFHDIQSVENKLLKIKKEFDVRTFYRDFIADIPEIVRDWVSGSNQLEDTVPYKFFYIKALELLTFSDQMSSMLLQKTVPSNLSNNKACFGSVLTEEIIERYLAGYYYFLPDCLKDWDPTEGYELNRFQQEAKGIKGQKDFGIIRAGCGEGKTLAAMLFGLEAIREGKARRLIVTLPTQFTSNNMYKDFLDKYHLPKEWLGIYHGEVASFLKSIDKQEKEIQKEEDEEEWLKEELFLNELYQKPVTISTVDHLVLGFLHASKNSDRFLSRIMDSVIIFDELHYYEAYTLKIILSVLRLLRYYQVPHLVMSATLPEVIMDEMEAGREYQVVDGKSEISIGEQGIIIRNPFIVKKEAEPLLLGEILNKSFIENIEQNIKLKQMVIVNQVERAKEIFWQLKEKFTQERKAVNLIVYHSSMCMEERRKVESLIRILFDDFEDKDLTPYIKSFPDLLLTEERVGTILIATQVCELSLDISADVIYSEQSPIDALGQRAGRLHRNGAFSDPIQCKETDYRSGCRCKSRVYPKGFYFTFYVYPLPKDDPQSWLPYVSEMTKDTNLNNYLWAKDVLEKSFDLIDCDSYTFPNLLQWVNKVYDNEYINYMQRACESRFEDYYRQDLIFGAHYKTRFGTGEQEISSGSFRTRLSDYNTINVLPEGYQIALNDLYDKSRGYKQTKSFWEKLNLWSVKIGERKYLALRRMGLVDEKSFDHAIPVLNVPYVSGVGFDFRSVWNKGKESETWGIFL